MTGGGLEPPWLGRATQCRAPTSTASPCPPTPTSSPTCWGACLLQPCRVSPSAGTAPPRQPVSKLFTPTPFFRRLCSGNCADWLLNDRKWEEEDFPFLCVCPGLPVWLRLIVFLCIPPPHPTPPRCVCVHMLLPSAGKRDSFIPSCLDVSYLKTCVLVNRERQPQTHIHTALAATLPPALSLIYKPTHTWKCQRRSQASELGWPKRSIVYLGNTNLANRPK